MAEHAWQLTLMAMILHPYFPQVQLTRLVKMCVIHDLGEALHGDIPAIHQDQSIPKSTTEQNDLLQLIDPLPMTIREDIVSLWDEYEAAATPGAKLAKALDKLATILQHNQGKNPQDFDYRFNLEYGKKYTTGDPWIERLRDMLDHETMQRATNAVKHDHATKMEE